MPGAPRRPSPAGPIKRYDRGTDPEVVAWPGGRTWLAHPDEQMRRASHALVVDGAGELATDLDAVPRSDRRVWVVEPLEFDGLDAFLAGLGDVAGVVVLAGLHRRDAAAVATRHGVSVHLPGAVAGLAPRIDAPTEVFEGRLAGTAFRALPVLHGHPWSEAVLYDGTSGTLVASEVLLTAERAVRPGERLAVGPWARLVPPRDALGDLTVERVVVGHGRPVLDDAQAALDRALATARRGLPGYLLARGPFMFRAGYVALRD